MDLQAIREISKKFHQLLCQHNKESKAQSRILFRSKAQKDRKNCSKNFWRFAAQVLDEDESSDYVAGGYFKDVYRSEDREYLQPDWLPSPPSPLGIDKLCYFFGLLFYSRILFCSPYYSFNPHLLFSIMPHGSDGTHSFYYL